MDSEVRTCQQILHCTTRPDHAPDVGILGRMSRYMHHTIKDKNQSIWIAQREGRAKDSNDRTQESVLKMLAMGGEGDIIDRLTEMNIVPLAISYEYDPCDYLKAQEFQLKQDIPDYKKRKLMT